MTILPLFFSDVALWVGSFEISGVTIVVEFVLLGADGDFDFLFASTGRLDINLRFLGGFDANIGIGVGGIADVYRSRAIAGFDGGTRVGSNAVATGVGFDFDFVFDSSPRESGEKE